MNPMAYACKVGSVETVKVLIEYGLKKTAGCGNSRMPPIGWAASFGHEDLLNYLLEIKAKVLSKDKFKRTPLILAVRNGHSRIASILLKNGAEWNEPDSSMNTPLHYAVGYGWTDCINLLLKAGASLNENNSWKNSPINIAMQMNHKGIVKRLLEE